MLWSPMQRLRFAHRFIKSRLHSPSVVSVLLKTRRVVQVDKKGHDSLTAGVQQERATERQQRSGNPLLRHSPGERIKGREQTCSDTPANSKPTQTGRQLMWSPSKTRRSDMESEHLQNMNVICSSDAPACAAAIPFARPPGIHFS